MNRPSAPPAPGVALQFQRPWLDRLGLFSPLALGYLGLLVFMIGDGVESGYLSAFLVENGLPREKVAVLFTVYGAAASVSAWLSGALSDLWGPKRVMWIGLVIWVIFQVLFLLGGIGKLSYPMMLFSYGLRGLGYPLFAFGFLVWVAAATPKAALGSAVGWFWFAFTGGLPTLGSLFASFSIPLVGPYATLWWALGLVVVGGLIALFGITERSSAGPLAPPGSCPLITLLSSVTLAWQNPKMFAGCVVRTINTAPQYGFLVFLPLFFTETIGFSLEQWLHILSYMFASNIVWNLLFGLIGDRLGWRQTVAWCGGVGCAISTLALCYIPQAAGPTMLVAVLVGMFYGATLAGYVPLSALMPSLSPDRKGAAMSLLNLGAGASVWVGPGIVALFLPTIGVVGVMWIFAGLYLLSAVLALFLTVPADQ